MQWSDEALLAMEQVPPFVRTTARQGVESFARDRGEAIITPELLRLARQTMEGDAHAGKAPTPDPDGGPEQQPAGSSRFFAREGVDPLRFAFARKTAIHAGGGGTRIVGRELALDAWEARAVTPDYSRRRTVYVHTPFCRAHCRFCGFFMYKLEPDSSRAYVDSLLREIRDAAALPAVAGQPLHAVYLGGGTPSDLAADDLERLLTALREHLLLANDCEITVEGRVDGFSVDKIQACLRGGANRFSIGVQSFDTAVRRQMGRRADRDEVLRLLHTLHDHNQAAVVIDLIYGFPGQTPEIWEEDVRTFVEETQLDGCDMYQLNVFRGGPLATAIEEGRVARAADLPAQAAMFRLGRKQARKARLRRLSMTHWGRTTRERNRYNSFTRYGATCIPFGCGAGGRLHGCSFSQEGDLALYHQLVAGGKKPVAGAVVQPERSALFSDLIGQIEEGAFNLPQLGECHHLDLQRLFAPLIQQWQRAGLLDAHEGGWLVLSEAGEFWYVTMAQAMIDFCNLVIGDTPARRARTPDNTSVETTA